MSSQIKPKVQPKSQETSVFLKKKLIAFFKIKQNFDILSQVTNKQTTYSLRLTEKFCNTYSEMHDVHYRVKDKPFNVHQSYEAQLDRYQKKSFDPFKRKHIGHPLFTITSPTGEKLVTALCQLNFFHWCIQNGIFDYIVNHLDAIKKDLMTLQAAKKKNIPIPTKKPKRTCVKRYISATLSFS